MRSSRILTRPTLRAAALAFALLATGSGAIVATDLHGDAPAVVAHVLPGDRAIAQVESLDPANSGVTFIVTQHAMVTETPPASLEPINMCIACDPLL